MTFEPVLPVWVLSCVTAAILVARVGTWRQLSAAGRTRTAGWRWAGVTLALLLLIAAAFRPVMQPDDETITRVADPSTLNVFLVVDRSPDMRVADYPDGQTRMAHARTDLLALIDRFPDARVAVISFDSRSALRWPLSADTWSLRSSIPTFEPNASAPGAVEQTNAGAAGNMLRYQLIGARQQYPSAKNLVYYLGAGAVEARTPPREFNLPERAVDGGAVLGYGSPEGGPIPGTEVAHSVVGEAALRVIASQIGVPYVARGDERPLAVAVADDATNYRPGPTAPSTAVARGELYWLPAALAATLVLVELYLVLREFRRTRLGQQGVIA
jgi:hypothetical protein